MFQNFPIKTLEFTERKKLFVFFFNIVRSFMFVVIQKGRFRIERSFPVFTPSVAAPLKVYWLDKEGQGHSLNTKPRSVNEYEEREK